MSEKRAERSAPEAGAVEAVLRGVARFLGEIREPLRGLLEAVLTAVRGEELGRDVAGFYRSLVENGVPEALAGEMAKIYLERKLATVASIAGLRSLGGPSNAAVIVAPQGLPRGAASLCEGLTRAGDQG